MGDTTRNTAPRIIDVVFTRQTRSTRTTLVFGVLAALAIHLGLAQAALRVRPSLESWSAELSVTVHEELSRNQTVIYPNEPPTPPDPEPPQQQSETALEKAEPTTIAPQKAPESPRARAPRPEKARAQPAKPAAAANVLSSPTSPTVDLTQQTYVVGQAQAYVGGVTTAAGTGKEPVRALTAGETTPSTTTQDRSKPVQLAQAEWRCPWPRDADDARIDAQVTTIAVLVEANGQVSATRVVRDEGFGFGRAAQQCALHTRFQAARDRDGRAIRAWSAPIRVHFSR